MASNGEESINKRCRIAFTRANYTKAVQLLPFVKDPEKLFVGITRPHGHAGLLYFAAKNGWLDVVKDLITNYKIEPTKGGHDFYTLHVAAANNHIGIVKYLITECHCNPMVTDDVGKSCLHYATADNHIDIVKYLITECNCDPMAIDKSGGTCLHYAAANNHIDIVKYLITECHCDPTVTDNVHKTCLHYAAVNNHIDIAKYLITECHCNPLVADNTGRTCLHFAAANNNIDIAKYLINECGRDLLQATDNNGGTCLHYAAAHNHVDITKYFIAECGCDPMVTDNNGLACLHYAAENNHTDIIKYLLVEYHCDPMIPDKNGITCLHYAATNDHIDVIKYLLTECCCDPRRTDKNGRTCLHYAAAKNSVKVLKYLITECNCDPMAVDKNGKTILHYATANNFIDTIKYLITEHGCDPIIADKNGKTCLDIAKMNDIKATFEYLSSNEEGVVRRFFNAAVKLATRKDEMISLFTKINDIKTSHPVDSYVNILLLGNPGAGKTTLAKVIADRSNGAFWGGSYRQVGSVELRTAGIIPIKIEHEKLGNIILHDFAGHSEYHSSHISIISNLLQGTGVVFVIVVDITKAESAKHLQQWLAIINSIYPVAQKSNDETQKSIGQCCIIVAASHVDEMTNATVRRRRTNELSAIISANCYNFPVPFTELDCRRLGGEVDSLFDELSNFCQNIRKKRKQMSLSLHCFMIYGLLLKSNKNILSISEIVNSPLKSHYVLPKKLHENKLVEILASLHSIGLIYMIKCLEHTNKVWVVVDKKLLLTEVGGILFAPQSFKQYRNIASNTGIITSFSLQNCFPKYDAEMLITFLTNMGLCCDVTSHCLTATNLIKTAEKEEKLLFFPALLNIDKPHNFTGREFKFGWCLQCTENYHFFPPHFFHTLMLHLAYKYGIPKHSSLDRQCSFWRNGIHFNREGAEALVEIVDESQCVLVLISCEEGYETNMTSLRKDVIIEIMDVQIQTSPCLKTTEFLIDPEELKYPIEKLKHKTVYIVAEIIKAVRNNKKFVNNDPLNDPHSENGNTYLKQKEIKQLLTNEEITNVTQLSIVGEHHLTSEELTCRRAKDTSDNTPTNYGGGTHLGDKPQLVDLMNLMLADIHVASQYDLIGTALKVPDLGLHPLPRYYKENLKQTLQWWLDNGDSVGSPVTWDNIIDAIGGPIVENKSLADEMRIFVDKH